MVAVGGEVGVGVTVGVRLAVLDGETVTVNDRKAREELGYRPVMSREQGLKEMTAGSPNQGTL